MTQYESLLDVASEALSTASKLMRSHSPGAITAKGDRDMASETDFLIERTIREFLLRRTPDIGFFGEEEGISNDNGALYWAFDPIDGTVNYIRGIPLCGVSLGLIQNTRPRLGVISLPFLDTQYSAIEGAGAFKGTRRISVAQTSNLHEAVVGMGDYAVGPDSAEKNRVRLAVTQQLTESVQRIRMNGSIAVDLTWLAEGKLDASVTLANHPWDIAAGVIIAREAGALVMDLDGTEHNLKSQATVVTNHALAPALLSQLQRAVAAINR